MRRSIQTMLQTGTEHADRKARPKIRVSEPSEKNKCLAAGVAWEQRGLIFDLRRFSTHDGPGIRTTVFLKGCPLRCLWCQNPEGLEPQPELFYFDDRCIACGYCLPSCPAQALSRIQDSGKIQIDRRRCTRCGACTQVCPARALAMDAGERSVRELLDEILLDRSFYKGGGGVTLSGGDPVFQAEFSLQLLRACRSAGLHTAMESSLYMPPDLLEIFLSELDLLLADFKLYDKVLHRAWTGVDNEVIIGNFRRLIARQRAGQSNPKVLVRIPLIPGYTAEDKNLDAIADFFLSEGSSFPIELLNYNPLARAKYERLGRASLFDDEPKRYSPSEMDAKAGRLRRKGLVLFHSAQAGAPG